MLMNENVSEKNSNKETEMKKLMIATVCVMGMFLTQSVAWAAGYPETPTPVVVDGTVPSNMWMVVSTTALKSYAKQQVRMANSYGGSGGIVLPGGRTWAEVATNNPDIRVIQQLLGREVLSFRVDDPEAPIYFYGQLRDGLGYGLFWGWTQFFLEKDSLGAWQVPTGAANVSANETAYQIPIYIPGVSSAYAVIRDANGNQWWVYLPVQNDRVMFYTSLAGLLDNGWSGKMVLGVGTNSAIYDMNSGTNIPTTLVALAVQMGIGGVEFIDDFLQIVSQPTSVNGQGVNPIYQVSVQESSKTVQVSGITSEGEVAAEVCVMKIGDLKPTHYPIPAGKTKVPVTFGQGIFDVWFVYPNAFPDAPSIPYQYYGGG